MLVSWLRILTGMAGIEVHRGVAGAHDRPTAPPRRPALRPALCPLA